MTSYSLNELSVSETEKVSWRPSTLLFRERTVLWWSRLLFLLSCVFIRLFTRVKITFLQALLNQSFLTYGINTTIFSSNSKYFQYLIHFNTCCEINYAHLACMIFYTFKEFSIQWWIQTFDNGWSSTALCYACVYCLRITLPGPINTISHNYCAAVLQRQF